MPTLDARADSKPCRLGLVVVVLVVALVACKPECMEAIARLQTEQALSRPPRPLRLGSRDRVGEYPLELRPKGAATLVGVGVACGCIGTAGVHGRGAALEVQSARPSISSSSMWRPTASSIRATARRATTGRASSTAAVISSRSTRRLHAMTCRRQRRVTASICRVTGSGQPRSRAHTVRLGLGLGLGLGSGSGLVLALANPNANLCKR